MPRRGSPYGYQYQKARERLLAGNPLCWWPGCSERATEADHDPPLVFHRHRGEGVGCCVLRPACGPHQRSQGGQIRAGILAALDRGESSSELADEPESGFAADDPVWQVEWLADLLDVPDDAAWPRFMTAPHPRAVGSLGWEFEWWVRTYRRQELLWWQRLVARRLLEVDDDGRLVWLAVILTMARQQGKSWLLWLLLAWRMHQGERFGVRQSLLHVSIDKAQAAGVMAEEAEFVRGDGYRLDLGTSKIGGMSIERSADRSRWDVITKGTSRSGGGYGRSSVSTAVVDEAWSILPTVVDDGLEPTLLQGVQAMLWLISTAHNRATSLMLARRHAGLGDLMALVESALLIEWSAPRDADISDEAGWRMASPWWTPQREERLRSAARRASLGISSEEDGGMTPVESFRAQYLNIWPLGSIDVTGSELLVEAAVWDAAEVDVTVEGPLVLAIDDRLGVGAGVAYAGLDDDDRIVLGGYGFESRAKAYRWVRALAGREGSVVLFGALLRDDPELQELDGLVMVEQRSSTDTRAGLSLLRELLATGRLVQDGQGESSDLRDQVTRARVKPAPGGGLSLVNTGKLDLVRAAAWAVAEAERGTLTPGQVFGGPMAEPLPR